jgi:hypothetical protein
MISSRFRPVHRIFAASLIGTFAVICAPAQADDANATAALSEESVINAFVPWQGRGFTFPTGPVQGTFVGAFEGIVYIQTDKGPMASGQMTCPAMVEFNFESGAQSGNGKCAISGEPGDRVFAIWSCEGIRLVGCRGTFTITGGTGRFEGATGGGPMLSRPSLQFGSSDMPGNVVSESARGIMTLDALKVVLPSKN